MWIAASLLWLSAAVSEAAMRAPGGAPMASITAKIDASEWDPPVYLWLNPESGAFSVTQIDPPTGRRGRKFVPFRSGALSPHQRVEVQAAFRMAVAKGLGNARCKEIVISNAGPRSLTVTLGKKIMSSPVEEGCWSSEARSLNDILTRLFW